VRFMREITVVIDKVILLSKGIHCLGQGRSRDRKTARVRRPGVLKVRESTVE